MSQADNKIISWILRGSIEFNSLKRDIDTELLEEALLPDYKELFKTIHVYFMRYKVPPTYEILSENLVEDLDTLQLVEVIKEEQCLEGEYKFYLDKIKNRYNIYLAKKLAVAADGDIEIQDFNKILVGLNSKIDRLHRSAVFSEGPVAKSADARYEIYKYIEENPNQISGVRTGYRELDEYIGGLKKQELMIIVGASSSGKSLLMMNIAINAWLGDSDPILNIPDESAKNVVYITLEMSKAQLEQRLDANVAQIRHKAIMRGNLEPSEKDAFKKSLEFQKEYGKRFYIVDIPRGSKMMDIEARYETILSEFEPDLICIDYLGIMKSNNSKNQSDWLDMGYIAEDMHEFCRRKNVPVISAAQRKGKDKKSKTQFNDIEEAGRSKMIGDNCNIMLLLESRDEEHLREDLIVHVVKNRDGEKGKLSLFKEFEKSRIIEPPDGWANDAGGENEI